MSLIREVRDSPKPQGVDEEVPYTIDTSPWGGSPSAVAVVLKDRDGTDMSATLLSGAASVAADTITTPKVIDLIAEMLYRLEVKFTTGDSILEFYCEIIGEE